MSASRTSAFTASGATSPLLKRLHGWSMVEAAGTPAIAHVRLRRTDATGAIIAQIKLAASGESQVGGHDIPVPEGVYVEVVTGTVNGVIYGG